MVLSTVLWNGDMDASRRVRIVSFEKWTRVTSKFQFTYNYHVCTVHCVSGYMYCMYGNRSLLTASERRARKGAKNDYLSRELSPILRIKKDSTLTSVSDCVSCNHPIIQFMKDERVKHRRKNVYIASVVYSTSTVWLRISHNHRRSK